MAKSIWMVADTGYTQLFESESGALQYMTTLHVSYSKTYPENGHVKAIRMDEGLIEFKVGNHSVQAVLTEVGR